METGKVKLNGKILNYIIDSDIGISMTNNEGELRACVGKEDVDFKDIVQMVRKGEIIVNERWRAIPALIGIPVQNCPFYEAEPDLTNAIAKIERKT
jgi:hypothetical protein